MDVGQIVTQVRERYSVAECSVGALDFLLQKRKMVEIFGWHPEVVDLMEAEYRKFLIIKYALNGSECNFDIVPNRLVDEFWHLHIMDTQKYQEDCQNLFGSYLHHLPYFGFLDEDDIENWKSASNIANDIWLSIFGEALYGEDDADAYVKDRAFHAEVSAEILSSKTYGAARCRTQCKPVKCK